MIGCSKLDAKSSGRCLPAKTEAGFPPTPPRMPPRSDFAASSSASFCSDTARKVLQGEGEGRKGVVGHLHYRRLGGREKNS